MPSRVRPALTGAAVLAAVTGVGLLAPAASAVQDGNDLSLTVTS